MGLWTTVMVVLPIVVIAVLVWNYRRQAAAREAASAERLKAFLSASAAAKASSGMAESVGASGGSTGLAVNTTGSAPNKAAQPARTLGAGVVAPVKVPGMPATPARLPVATGFTARPQLTSTAHLAHLAVYQLLQSALPGHTVLPCMSLAAFIQPPAALAGFALEAERRRLADISVDFLICNAQLKPLAVVHCAADVAAPSQQTAFAASCAASTGLRWLSLPSDPLPAPEEIRQRVLAT